MPRIIIVGAGDFGRELYGWIDSDSSITNKENIYFIDDNENCFEWFPSLSDKYLCKIEEFKNLDNDKIFLAICEPSARQRIKLDLDKKNITLSTYINETSIVSTNSIIGNGSIICPFVTIGFGSKLGENVILNKYVSIGHDVEIGEFSSIMGFSDLMGWSAVEPCVFIGGHVTILPKVKIFEAAKVGAGSVVIADVRSGMTVFGNPARYLRVPTNSSVSTDN
jgi:sugar O-acyltransferase (sialic acid O-acetyltransferase NeuD family)